MYKNKIPINTIPGTVWNIEIIGRITLEKRGTRESAIPKARAITNPIATDIKTYPKCTMID